MGLGEQEATVGAEEGKASYLDSGDAEKWAQSFRKEEDPAGTPNWPLRHTPVRASQRFHSNQ